VRLSAECGKSTGAIWLRDDYADGIGKEFCRPKSADERMAKNGQRPGECISRLSVYGTGSRLNISFDNMCDRKIVGTNDWKKYEIVLDVPADGTKLGYGVILSGVGQVWVDDFTFEIVDQEVDVTDYPCSEKRKQLEEDRLPLMPVNLSFDAS
jgi:hypothetical protein